MINCISIRLIFCNYVTGLKSRGSHPLLATHSCKSSSAAAANSGKEIEHNYLIK